MAQVKLLISDDKAELHQIYRRALNTLKDVEFGIMDALNGQETMECLQKNPYDIVILDINLTDMDGVEMLKEIKETYTATDVVMITAYPDTKTAIECMKMGAYDYLVKPFDLEEFKMTLKRCVETRMLKENLGMEQQLRKEIEKSHRNLQKFYVETVQALTKSVEIKDPYTLGHSERVSKISVLIAKKMGYKNSALKTIELAGLFHDIGKIGVSEYILNKKSGLTADEFEEIKKHPEFGASIISNIEMLKDVVPIVRSHHERFNGSGYPGRLKREDIPLGARIVSVADVFDAMNSDRSYRGSFGKEKTVLEIEKNSGMQFDPAVVKNFIYAKDAL